MNLHIISSSLSIISFSWLSIIGITSIEAAVPDRLTDAASGLITGLTGTPTALGPANGAARSLKLGDTVSIAEQLRTQLDDTVEILWDRRAVILMQPQSSLMIHETKPGETHVDLTGGTVRVALAYGSRPSDMVIVHTPTSRVFTRGGIVEVDVLPSPPSFLSRVGAMFSRAESPAIRTPLEAVRVLEGQSGIEPLQSPGRAQMLDAGVQARIAAGAVEQMSDLPAAPGKGVGLSAADRRQGTPGPLTQSIVRVHINHALEVERLMSATPPSLDQTAKAAGADVKGTIVATSLGVPTTSFSQAQTGLSGSSAPPASPVITPPITTLAPNQSGGANSHSIITTILSNQKSKGKGKGN